MSAHLNRKMLCLVLSALIAAIAGCGEDDNSDRNTGLPPYRNDRGELCSNTCFDAYDGICDDGGPDSFYAAICPLGTDCADCGIRGSDSGSTGEFRCLYADECDDGEFCNGSETCVNGSCRSGVPVDCDDADVCTDDTCDPAMGCVNARNNRCDGGAPVPDPGSPGGTEGESRVALPVVGLIGDTSEAAWLLFNEDSNTAYVVARNYLVTLPLWDPGWMIWHLDNGITVNVRLDLMETSINTISFALPEEDALVTFLVSADGTVSTFVDSLSAFIPDSSAKRHGLALPNPAARLTQALGPGDDGTETRDGIFRNIRDKYKTLLHKLLGDIEQKMDDARKLLGGKLQIANDKAMELSAYAMRGLNELLDSKFDSGDQLEPFVDGPGVVAENRGREFDFPLRNPFIESDGFQETTEAAHNTSAAAQASFDGEHVIPGDQRPDPNRPEGILVVVTPETSTITYTAGGPEPQLDFSYSILANYPDAVVQIKGEIDSQPFLATDRFSPPSLSSTVWTVHDLVQSKTVRFPKAEVTYVIKVFASVKILLEDSHRLQESLPITITVKKLEDPPTGPPDQCCSMPLPDSPVILTTGRGDTGSRCPGPCNFLGCPESTSFFADTLGILTNNTNIPLVVRVETQEECLPTSSGICAPGNAPPTVEDIELGPLETASVVIFEACRNGGNFFKSAEITKVDRRCAMDCPAPEPCPPGYVRRLNGECERDCSNCNEEDVLALCVQIASLPCQTPAQGNVKFAMVRPGEPPFAACAVDLEDCQEGLVRFPEGTCCCPCN